MAFEIIVKPIVFLDLDEAMLWYENEQKGLSLRFFKSFETAIKTIKRNPNAFVEVTPGVKRILLRKFPYKVFYTVSENTIFILGVFHSKRSNAFIRKKLKGIV